MEKKNPNTKLYTWYNKPCTSDCLDENNITASIVTTPLRDHNVVSLPVSFGSNITNTFRSSYWKLTVTPF